jgi:hypothetical protein
LIVLLAIAASCGKIGSSSFNAKPADVYAIMPSQSDVRSLLGDSSWWAGPPSFEVDPLDSSTTPATQKFAVSRLYLHLGTDEHLQARYAVFDKASSATTVMTNLQTRYGASVASTPKVGDQVLYYAVFGTGAAPYVTRTFVRVGQIVLALVWTKKDSDIKIEQLGKNAKKFADPLRNVGKVQSTPRPVDQTLLPPPGRDITLLGSADLPLESFPVMINAALPGPLLTELRANGASTFTYGDYALNNDTHMEVQTALLRFSSSFAASQFAGALAPGTPDSDGIAGAYLKTGGGSPGAGEYHFVFASGLYSALIICKASVEGEAASRECEDPIHNTALAWKLGLGAPG